MFIGRFYHNLESKGRLAIPATFRKDLGKKPIITRGLDGCLFLIPTPTWDKLTQGLRGSPLTKQDTREFIRLIAHDAHPASFDAQGRTLIPKTLREYAKINRSAVIAGSLDWIEIWDRDKYHHQLKSTEKRAEIVAERLSQASSDSNE